MEAPMEVQSPYFEPLHHRYHGGADGGLECLRRSSRGLDAQMWVSGGSDSDIVALSTTSLILVVIPYVTSVELRFNHTSLKDQLAWT